MSETSACVQHLAALEFCDLLNAHFRGSRLKRESCDLMDAVAESQQKAHRAVNSGILGKVAETNELRVGRRLNNIFAENH